MRMMRAVALAALAAALVALTASLASQPASADEFGNGPWSFPVSGPLNLGTQSKPLARFSPFHLSIYYPQTCTSQCGAFASGFPVLVFVTGFGGSIPIADYNTLFISIAKQGIVVVAVDVMYSGLHVTTDYVTLGAAFSTVVGYVTDTTSGMVPDLVKAGMTGTVIFPGNRVFLGGHSSGCHISLEYINQLGLNTLSCNSIAGVALISPLDGQDPLGLGSQYLVPQSGGTLSFQTPGVMITASLDPVPGSVQGASCVPADRGYMHFYNAWNQAAMYSIQYPGVGHLDILDDGSTTSYDGFCASANTTDPTVRQKYRAVAKGTIVSFLEGVVLGNSIYFNKLTTLSLMTAATSDPQPTLMNKGTPKIGCAWSPVSTSVNFELQIGLILFGVCFALVFIGGLYCFFRKMDDDTLGRYVVANEPLGVDKPKSFQAALLQPGGANSMSLGPSVSQMFQAGPANSAQYNSQQYNSQQYGGSQQYVQSQRDYELPSGAYASGRIPSVQV